MDSPTFSRLADLGPGHPTACLYVHVPFCRDRCTYCAFATVYDDPSAHGPLVAALLAEADRSPFAAPLTSVYLGGGTPGLLPPGLVARLLDGLRGRLPFSPGAEITLEANPGNVTPAMLGAWAGEGITRISLGIQTFHARTLRRLGRHHDPDTARNALSLLARRWRGSWSADLLVGWAGQTVAAADADVVDLLAFRPPHVSVYALTIEPRTSLAALARLGRTVTAPGSLYPDLDTAWSDQLARSGYERYEVSNFALPGHRSRHNQAYWANRSYIGLGPSAASSVHPLRWSNRSDLPGYLSALSGRRSVRATVERVRPFPRLLESLSIGLRTADGLAVHDLARRFGPACIPLVRRASATLLAQGMLVLDTGRLAVPSDFLVRADAIVMELADQLHGMVGQPSLGSRKVARQTELLSE